MKPKEPQDPPALPIVYIDDQEMTGDFAPDDSPDDDELPENMQPIIDMLGFDPREEE